MNTPSAATKIVQPSRSRLLLHRPRLVRFLHEHMDRRLIVVSAAVGSGKTALLIDFAHETLLPVCWYSLEASDADPQVFLDYLIAALQHRFPKIGARARRVLANSSADQNYDAVVGALASEMQANVPESCVLIFDDYHTIAQSDAVNRLLGTLLFLLPGQVHVILASRTMPSQLDLTRLQMQQHVLALGNGDLQFNGDEVRALARQNYRIELSPEQAQDISVRSEGWIAGILLTTPGLWPSVFQSHIQSTGGQENLFRFLANEAFGHLSSELQRFLLDSSIFNRLEPAICDKVLEIRNSFDLLRSIEEQNLFVVRLNDNAGGPVYRYHILFQEFLTQRLLENDPQHRRLLHRRAAKVYAARPNLIGQAISHYLAAEMFDEAARLIEQIAQSTFDTGRWSALAGWIDVLPQDVLQVHPQLIVMRGLVFAEIGKPADAQVAYTTAIDLFTRNGDLIRAAKAEVWRAMLWNVSGRYRDAVQVCETVLPILQKNQAQWEEARVYRILGTAHVHLGEYPRCVDELEKALKLYQDLDDEPRVAWLHHDLGTCLRIHGDSNAGLHFQQALQVWRRIENTVGRVMTLNSIGVGHHLAGDYEQAMDTLEDARVLAHETGNHRGEAFALASLGDVYRDLGQLIDARQAYQSTVELSQSTEGFILTYALIALAETLRLLDADANIDSYLQQALTVAEAHQSNYEIGLTETARGIGDDQQDRPEAAIQHLERAVKMLKPMKRDYVRAQLHLARVYFEQRRFEPALRHLKMLVENAAEVEPATIPFIVADRNLLHPLLKYAESKKIHASFFRRLQSTLNKLERRAQRAAPVRVEVYVLGQCQVKIERKEITLTDWGTQSTRELFLLLLNHADGLRKDEILEALWPDKDPKSASTLFHTTSYRLRQLITKGMIYTNGVYLLRTGLNLSYDVTQFGEQLKHAREAKGMSDRIEAYEAAVALYRGDFFEESYNDWCRQLRLALHQQYLTAEQTLAEIYERHGNFGKAFQHYEALLAKACDREDIYRAMMRLHLKMGDRGGAIRTYQRCVQVLQDELNVDSPDQETQNLYAQIIQDGSSAKVLV